MSEGVPITVLLAIMAVFFTVTALIGYYGYRNTKNNQDFLLGRKKSNAFIIALAYGATFLSASAVIGFGGQAALHGLSLIWLCFLNLFMGLLVAFIVFGRKTRRLGRRLNASTFADLLGKIYGSNGIRAFTAVIIIIMMPIYCAAVLKGGVNSFAVITGLTDYYDLILLVMAVVVGVYVVLGGIIAVMYNDALQALIMFVGMGVILVATFSYNGGVNESFTALADLSDMFPHAAGTLEGFRGWDSVAEFGSPEWLVVVTTFILGVGIGAVTQPQLIVRYMSAKDDRTLNKSLVIGTIFVFFIVGAAYTTGALCNVYFFKEFGQIAGQYVTLGTDFIIPTYILEVFSNITFGDVFVCLFLLTLLCASISTISALMHTIGVAGGYDLVSVLESRVEGRSVDFKSLRVNRILTAVVMVLVIVYCYLMPADIIAKATSLFMGMTAAALLPAYTYGLYSKKPLRMPAFLSIAVGSVSYLVWALFVNSSMSVFLPICKLLTGDKVLFATNIQFVDPLLIALPLSTLVLLVGVLVARAGNKDAGAEAPAE